MILVALERLKSTSVNQLRRLKDHVSSPFQHGLFHIKNIKKGKRGRRLVPVKNPKLTINELD